MALRLMLVVPEVETGEVNLTKNSKANMRKRLLQLLNRGKGFQEPYPEKKKAKLS